MPKIAVVFILIAIALSSSSVLFSADKEEDANTILKRARECTEASVFTHAIGKLLNSEEDQHNESIASLLSTEERLKMLDPDGIGPISKANLYKCLSLIVSEADSQTASRMMLSVAKSEAFTPFSSSKSPKLGRSRVWLAAAAKISSPTDEMLAFIGKQAKEDGAHRLEAVKSLGMIGNAKAIGQLQKVTEGKPDYRANTVIWIQKYRNRPQVFRYIVDSFLLAGKYSSWVLNVILTNEDVVPQKPGGPVKKVPTYQSMPDNYAKQYVKELDRVIGSSNAKKIGDEEHKRLQEIRLTMIKKAEVFAKQKRAEEELKQKSKPPTPPK
jgi:hypothetical protein